MKATVVILTYNGEEFLNEVLISVLGQEVSFDYEVLVIDSGSNDNTLNILKKYPSIRIHQIKKEEFGHGKTRNLAVDLANGEIVVFLTQDATPVHKFWLREMIRPFDISSQIAAVIGKQKPRHNCCSAVKNEIIRAFKSLGPDESLALYQFSDLIANQQALDKLFFYSDVNSALRKSYHSLIPYRNIDYAEDQAFGIDIIKAGLIKAYTPFGSVLHSHNYSICRYFKRKYTEVVGFRNATGQDWCIGIREMVIEIVKGIFDDWVFILKDKDYNVKAKIKWLLLTPFYQISWKLAIFLASKNSLLTRKVKNLLSLSNH